jgi:hypothetical protein
MSDKPLRDYREWLRQKVWPFAKRQREGAPDSVLPHLEEFSEQSSQFGQRQKAKVKKPDSDKPHH